MQPHRVVKLQPIVQVPLRPSSLPADTIPISYYPGQQRHHHLGRGCSSRSGAGQGIFALTDMPLNDFAPQHKYNIVCQYGGKRISLSTAEHPNYPSDYLWGWPEYDEAIDGQLDTTGSIGPSLMTTSPEQIAHWRHGATKERDAHFSAKSRTSMPKRSSASRIWQRLLARSFPATLCRSKKAMYMEILHQPCRTGSPWPTLDWYAHRTNPPQHY